MVLEVCFSTTCKGIEAIQHTRGKKCNCNNHIEILYHIVAGLAPKHSS